jgi:leucyl aminopeptidase
MEGIAAVDLISPEGLAADLVVVGVLEGEEPDLRALPEALRPLARQAAARRGFGGRDDQVAQVAQFAQFPQGVQAGGEPGGPVVALYGLGGRHQLTAQKLARFLVRVAEDAAIARSSHMAFALPEHPETVGAGGAGRVLRNLALAGYVYDRHKSDSGDDVNLERVELLPPPGHEAAYREARQRARAVADAVAFCRSLANTPANVASPAYMEEVARELGASRGMAVTVLGQDELERRGMGGLLAVGAGSVHPPRLVKLDWDPAGGSGGPGGPGGPGDKRPRIALVGKGVTFDSGGISIKPAADMDHMKFDKCGACTVLAVARAVADLELPVRLSVYVPLAENMLSSRAYRPGDILRCYNGKTVEVTNTDAEGRLILADAIALAVEEGAETLVEYSTLTGACVVALGHQAAGLFSPDDALADSLLAAGRLAGERLWRLPLYPEFLEEMKGHHADLRNSASRWAGASTAAAFLSQFVGGLTSWAHLDIAGVAYQGAEKPPGASATGFGVASAVEWLENGSVRV